MLDTNKRALSNIMQRYKTDLSGLEDEKKQQKVEQDQFMKEFSQVRQAIIWPAIVEVGNQLNEYGHDYHVTEQEEYVDATAHYHQASITLNIYPSRVDKAFYKNDATPYISFVADRYAQKVGILVSTMMPGEGGLVGSRGQYEIGKITPEFVEKEIVTVLEHTLIFK